MKKKLTKDKLWVLKWRGLWKVSHRRHSHHCKEKYVPKKKKQNLVGKFFALQKPSSHHRIVVVEQDIKSVFTLLQLYCTSTQHY